MHGSPRRILSNLRERLPFSRRHPSVEDYSWTPRSLFHIDFDKRSFFCLQINFTIPSPLLRMLGGGGGRRTSEKTKQRQKKDHRSREFTAMGFLTFEWGFSGEG